MRSVGLSGHGSCATKWQATPNWTINAGVRWSTTPSDTATNNKGLRYLNLNTGNVLIGGYGSVPQNDASTWETGSSLASGCRLSCVSPALVVRAGYGMSADPNNWRYFRNAYPAVILDTNSPQNPADYIPAASLTGLNGTGLGGGSYSVPTGFSLLPVPNLSSGVIPLPTSASTTTIPNPFRRGYINSYNLMVQQDMGWLVFQAGYVGTMAVRPLVNMNANASLPGTGSCRRTSQARKYVSELHRNNSTNNSFQKQLLQFVADHGHSPVGNGSMAGLVLHMVEGDELRGQ